MTNQRVCANNPVFSRRTALVSLAISPMALSASPSLATVDVGRTSLEIAYIDWLNARRDLDEAADFYQSIGITDEIEKKVLEPLWHRADAIEETIVDAPCRTASDLAIKLLTVVNIHREAYSEKDMDRIMADAQSLVNLTSNS